MATIYQLPIQLPGTNNTFPNFKFMVTGDSTSAMSVPGYLNSGNLEGNLVAAKDVIHCLYNYNTYTGIGEYAIFTVEVNLGVISLVLFSDGESNDVILPTIANHIATYYNTAGTITEDAATAINGGNIQAGLSGTAGYLSSFPGTASKGSLRMTAVANSGDTVTTLSNNAMGQASTINIPDPSNAIGQLCVGATATPFVAGNLIEASNTSGLMIDSGIPAADVVLVTDAVLLDPSGNQSIIAYDLAITDGGLTTLDDLQATEGNVIAGSDGNQGSFVSYPGTASSGALFITAANNASDVDVIISNASHAQTSAYAFSDCGNAQGVFLNAAGATPFTAGHFPEASGTTGLMVDSGIGASDLITTSGTTTMQVGSYLQFYSGSATLSSDACTINQQVMNVTTEALTTAQYGDYNFTVNNSLSVAGRPVLATISVGEGTNLTHGITVSATGAAGFISCTLTNLNTAALNGTVVINLLLL